MEILKKLTIVTITYNNEEELDETLASCSILRDNGCRQIIQNGGKHLERSGKEILVINEKDFGIYDALDRGMSRIDTKYIINIHSGDKFIGQVEDLVEILEDMEAKKLDISLNDQLIPFGNLSQNRIHSSQRWKPYMLRFGVQPPHMPTIFRTDIAKQVTYRKNEKVIGDFFQYVDLFNLKPMPKWRSHGKLIIRMAPGGNTTRGLKSVVYVSKQFIRSFGPFRGLLIAILRLPFKLIQARRK